MQDSLPMRRFDGAPTARFGGVEVPVAVGFHARLLGLAGLDREAAGAGLLIPGCAAVHTFGMRFSLDLVFLDQSGQQLAIRRAVPPRRLARHPGADAVLELPAPAVLASRPIPPDSGQVVRGGGEPGLVPPE